MIWWRLDVALDLDMIYASARLGAAEALRSGTTVIIDHHESPNAIEGSLSAIEAACSEVGVSLIASYGVTDRHGPDGARRGLAENERFIRSGGRGMVGVHAAFTCSDATLESAAGLAADLGVGVHIHVAEAADDRDASRRLERLADDSWLLAHCVELDRPLPGTIAHNARSNMNNSVGYARPTIRANRIVLGSDGIGADMLEEARLTYARLREFDLAAGPDLVWGWLQDAGTIAPEADQYVVDWDYDHMESPGSVMYTPGVRALNVTKDGETLLCNGALTRVDLTEVRAKAAEQAVRLAANMED